MATNTPGDASQRTPALRLDNIARDWYVQEWLLLLFAAGMLLFIYFVARHEAELERSEIIRDAALIEQSISRKLDADQSFLDRLALDVGDERFSPNEFDQLAGKRAIESGYITEILRVKPNLDVVRHAPGVNSLEAVQINRAPFSDQIRMSSFAESTSRSTYSQPYRSGSGRFFIEYAAPVYAQTRFDGTISAIISFDALVQKAVPEWAPRKYRMIISDSEGNGMTSAEAMQLESSTFQHTIAMSLPWRDLSLTLTGAKPSSFLPNLTLSTAVIALTGLMVWTLMSLRKQQQMRKLAEVERDRVYLQSIASLRDTNERFETVLDSLDVSVYVTDFETNAILFANLRAREVFPNLMVGKYADPFEAGFVESPSARYPAQTLIDADGQPGDVFIDELEHRASSRFFLTRTRAVRWVDGRIARLTTLGDITDRVNAERIRQTQQDKLTRTSRLMTVGEIASTLAHEINQPLAAIANYVNGCIRRLRGNGNPDPTVISAMEKAEAQVTRAGAIISRVREFVRTREPNRRAIDINEFVDETAKLIQSDDEERALRCVLKLDPALPDVFADRIMIEQVLLNLLRNAREAMQHLPPDQRVAEVRVRRIDEAMAAVEVADRGSGISPEAASQLFSPFFSTKNDGMGMGLNICRSLIEYHEGRLTFQDNPGGGTIFRFTLPFDEGNP
jgi:signal transduction histidine kinase/sensor domain CHASE-containing protein